MIQEVQKIERYVKERREIDVPLMSWPLYLIVSLVTLFIYPLIMWVKRINRVDGFIERKYNYYLSILDYTEKYAQEKGREEEFHNEIKDLRDEVENTFNNRIKKMNAGLTVFLTLITLGLYSFYSYYVFDKVWYSLQTVEQDFDDRLSLMLTKLGILKYPLSFNVDSSKKRSFGLNLFLSAVTFGVWGLVWDYHIHTDPDKIYKEFHGVEDAILQTVRQV